MIFDDDEEFFNPNGRQAPQTLLGQIRERGNMSSALAQQRADRDERNSEIVNNVTYGRQSEGPYSMENFIVEVLELDTSDENVRTMINWGEAGSYIIDKAVETINSGSKEIHFTPEEDTEYKKIKFIYDKLANDIKQMICRHLKLSPCPLSNDDVISAALTKYPDIRFPNEMTIGFKLKTIEDYIENKMKSEAKGGRRRKRGISKKRSSGKRSDSKKKSGGKRSDGKKSRKRCYSRKRKI
jgi:hypothetical protein